MAEVPDWSLATWEGSRRRQHREYQALPFRAKLEQLERLAEFASRFGPRDSERHGFPDVHVSGTLRADLPPVN